MKDLKETLTTYAALIAAVCGFIIILSQSGINMPSWLVIVCGAVPSFCTTVVGIFTGRDKDGKKKVINKEASGG